jgi:hypothetical protein
MGRSTDLAIKLLKYRLSVDSNEITFLLLPLWKTTDEETFESGK